MILKEEEINFIMSSSFDKKTLANKAFEFTQHIIDECGPRLAGNPSAAESVDRLVGLQNLRMECLKIKGVVEGRSFSMEVPTTTLHAL